ncbi:alpha-1-antichymotrypsin-like [Sorex araneus]|uniref:alpha-1-antichymotrypsin-like n=1 Tax=Sorex araneus TaxID=42254 RepID=UPI0024338E07|nr:alpha-1-antichymotrypsin-like [Sorex araneus]
MSVLLALLLGAVLCPHVLSLPEGTTEPETVTQVDSDSSTLVGALSLARSNTDFAFSLYKLLAAQSPETNVIFSPLSVSMALAFLALGARGHTQTEILEGLKFNLTETPEANIHRGFQQLLRHLSRPGMPLQLDVNTAMFLDQQLDLQEGFREEARELYAADALSADFQDTTAAEKLINDYVELKTRGKIKELVKGLDAETRMVLVNCLFFKAQWKTPFDPYDTHPSNFHVSKSRKVKVPMMNAEDIRVPYFQDKALGCTVVQLPYKASSACALLVLPDEGHMAEVEAALLPGTLQRWRDSLEMRTITLRLPKFSVSGDYDLKQVLADLGLRSVFSRDADLSGITQAENLHVSQVVHKAVLDVAEEGTEAAAATGIKIVPLSARLYKTIVKFNRPFLVALLSEDTKSILFLGKVADPQQA